MKNKNKNYSRDKDSEENFNPDDKYSNTGESEFSRESTVPFDSDEVLSERHYNLHPLEHSIGREKLVSRSGELGEAGPVDHRGKGPKGYKRTDEMIEEDVNECLYRRPEVDASGISVKVKEGVVKLSGFVESLEQKNIAEMAIKNLSGISKVYNDISISHKPNKNPPKGLIDNITGLN